MDKFFRISLPIKNFCKKKKFDLIIFNSPSVYTLFCKNINFVASIWNTEIDDLKNFIEFDKKNFDYQKNIINKIVKDSFKLLVFTNKNKKDLLKLITNAGAIFLGEYTPEVFGDYCAGPNHVLPTSGSARFSSPLGVYDFQKRSSLISISRKTATALSKISVSIALSEGLQAHALAAKYRDK